MRRLGAAGEAGALRRRVPDRDGAGRFRLCTCGTRRAAARALPRGTACHRLAAVTSRGRTRTGKAILPALQS